MKLNPLNKVAKPAQGKDKAAQQAAIEIKKKTAQEWIPVKDIHDNIAYRRDGHLVLALKVEAVNLDLLSKNEVKRIISSLHEVLNGQQEKFQIMTIGRPVDLDSYIGDLQSISSLTDNTARKRLLQGYIKQAASMASGGEVLERRFFIILSHAPDKMAVEELTNRARELSSNLIVCSLKTEVCTDQEITNLLFNFTHPAQSAYERVNTGPYLPPILKYE